MTTSPSREADWNYTPDFLGLPYWRTIAYSKSEYDYEVIGEPLTLPECPDCDRSRATLRPVGTLVQKITDEPRESCRVRVHFIRQRFQCSCGRNLLQPLPGVVAGRSITTRAAARIALECFDRSFEDVGNSTGVSSRTAKELFADLICAVEAVRKIEAPRMLGIDGVCVGRRKYKRNYCLLTDLSNSAVLELLGTSTQLEVARFLQQLPGKENVRFVMIDMAKGFLNAVEKALPRAKVGIDPYHVVSKLNDAVTKVVRMKQENLSPAEHKRLMRGGNRFLLLKRRHELTNEQKSQLDAWFEKVPEFKQAYDLKEAGYDIYKSTTRRSAEKNFAKWEWRIPENLEPAFRDFLNMVKRWEPYIFNYFDFKVSNAYTESKNRDVKSLQRHGRRTSFPVLRARLIHGWVVWMPERPKAEIKAGHIRKAMKEASAAGRIPETWDPNSYVARINDARKAANEFSRLMRPGKGWEERFGHFSHYSKEKSTHKWDFIWPVEGKPKKGKG
jgi:transposase